MSPLACALSRPAVRWSAAEGLPLSPVIARHASHCVRCQAEAARVRTTLRNARHVFPASETPPPGLARAVMAGTVSGAAHGGHPVRNVSAVATAAALFTFFVIYRSRLSST